jgi:nicotinate-nucleotide adenylyltransferase
MRIGLLGGSFNPPHNGHIHISETAIKRLGLDCVWWLVTPQNPLKPPSDTPPQDQRLEWCRDIARTHPKIVVSDLERDLESYRTHTTLRALRRRFPGVDFIFLIGSDLVPQLPRWYRWKDIPKEAPIAIIRRPPAPDFIGVPAIPILPGGLRGGALAENISVVNSSEKPPLMHCKIYEIRNGPTSPLSSSMIRNLYKTNS